MVHQPIDEGWAWLICLGTSIQAFCVIGGLKTMGVFFVEILEIFDAPSAVTSLTLGLSTGAFAVFAMMTNALIITVGPRVVTMFGAILYSFSVFMASFKFTVGYIIVTLGLMTGLAMGAMVTPSIILLSYYFDKRRSLANGLAVVGSSIGQLILPYLVTWAIEQYAYSGAMMIYSAIVMHSIPAALLLRPVSFWDRRHKWSRQEASSVISSSKDLMKDDPVSNGNTCVEYVVDDSKAPMSHTIKHQALVHNHSPAVTITESHPSPMVQAAVTLAPGTSVDSINFIGKHAFETPSKPGYKIGPIRVKTMPLKDFCSVMFSRRIIRSPCIWILFFAMAFGHAGFLNTVLHFPVLSLELFHEKTKGAMFVTIIAMFDLVGRVGGGWFSDLGYMSRSSIVTMGFTVSGVSTILVTFYPVVPTLVVYCVLSGLFGGLYRILLPVIIGDFFGMQNIGAGVSILFMSLGTVILFIPTVLGYMQSVLGSYLHPYQLCGALSLFAAMLMIVLEFVKKYDDAVVHPNKHDIVEVAVSSHDSNHCKESSAV